MALYMMLGTYADQAVDRIHARRTREAVGVIERLNGQVVSMYAMLGIYDIVLVVNLPGNREAMEASVGLTRETGIRFTTGPVIPIERFDEMIGAEDVDIDFENDGTGDGFGLDDPDRL